MLLPATRALALRVGWCAGDPVPGANAAGDVAPGACLAELPYEGADNPWNLDACLVLVEPLPGEKAAPAEVIDRVSNSLRRDSPDAVNVAASLPEALLAAHAYAREPAVGVQPRFRLSLAAVREGCCWAAQAPGLPAYLLREGALRPLPAEVRYQALGAEEGDLEPEIVTATLQDGDALLLCSQSVHEALSDRDVHDLLIHAANPEVAARKLVREALVRGAHHPSAAVLFAGVGPAVAYRLRPTRESVAPVASQNRRSQRSVPPLGLVAALTGLAGALLGVTIGVLISMAGRPAPAEISAAPSLDSAAAPILPSAGLQPMAPTPPPPAVVQPVAANPPVTLAGAPATPGNSPAAGEATASVLPSSPAQNAPPAPVASPVPAALEGEPPRHGLAPGLSGGIQLTLRADLASGTLGLQLNQGVMFTSGIPQGIPVGETLPIPLHDLQRAQPTRTAELRLLSPGQPPVSVTPEAVTRLFQGEPVTVPGLRPGAYDLAWWDSRAAAPGQPFLSLRIQGL